VSDIDRWFEVATLSICRSKITK